MHGNPIDFINRLVLDMAEPLVILDAEKRLLFCTRSFEELVSITDPGCYCTSFLLNTILGERGFGCCWDVLHLYIQREQNAIWIFQGINNEPFSAICQFTPISVLGKLQFVIIKLSRIEACTPRSILGFFQAIRSSLGDSGYEHWLTKYLKETHGFKLAFLSAPNFLHTDDVHDGMSSRLQSFAKGAGQNLSKGLPFDIKLTRGSENLIFHAFPCGETTKNGMLFVSGKNIQIGPIAAQELRAAAMAANGNLSTQANHDFDVNIGHCAFTGVERQVLQLLVEGCSDKEIAERLSRSVHTVKNRVRNMMEKVQVNKRTMLVALVTGVRSRTHHE